MLGDLIELHDGMADLFNPGRLFCGCLIDVRDQGADLLRLGHDVPHGGASFAHQLTARLDLLHAVANQGFDFLGGFRTALRQSTHLSSHHRKTAPLLARTRSFHRSIQGQDIGLERNAINHPDDVGDLA